MTTGHLPYNLYKRTYKGGTVWHSRFWSDAEGRFVKTVSCETSDKNAARRANALWVSSLAASAFSASTANTPAPTAPDSGASPSRNCQTDALVSDGFRMGSLPHPSDNALSRTPGRHTPTEATSGTRRTSNRGVTDREADRVPHREKKTMHVATASSRKGSSRPMRQDRMVARRHRQANGPEPTS